MAFERRERCARALQPNLVIFCLKCTASSTNLTAAAGDISLVDSITTESTDGQHTFVLKQCGYTLVGVALTPLIASPGTGEPSSVVLKSIDTSTKTFVTQALKGDGSADDYADNDGVFITLFFTDSYGQ
jgi:hypothetical protein